MTGIKIWETPLSWHAKYSLPVAVRVSKTRVLKLPVLFSETVRAILFFWILRPPSATSTGWNNREKFRIWCKVLFLCDVFVSFDYTLSEMKDGLNRRKELRIFFIAVCNKSSLIGRCPLCMGQWLRTLRMTFRAFLFLFCFLFCFCFCFVFFNKGARQHACEGGTTRAEKDKGGAGSALLSCSRASPRTPASLFLRCFVNCCRSKCFPVCRSRNHFLRKQKCFWICSSFARRGNISGNNVSSTMFPRLWAPLLRRLPHMIRKEGPLVMEFLLNRFMRLQCSIDNAQEKQQNSADKDRTGWWLYGKVGVKFCDWSIE